MSPIVLTASLSLLLLLLLLFPSSSSKRITLGVTSSPVIASMDGPLPSLQSQ